MEKATQIKMFLLIALITSCSFYSQEILKPTNERTYSEYMNKVLEPLVKEDLKVFKSGILYDRVYPIANLNTFNDTDSTNVSNYEHFMRSWNEIESASQNFKGLPASKAGNIAYSFERENKIQIGIINVDFTYINPNALAPNKSTLEVVNKKIKRISTQKLSKLRKSRSM